ncbi:TylF/MycF family methyltransferase [Candidatus Saccharibacteria bacterium]|nr:TylF/MycF family methyltransferase [Candidatus Saccharibacteria bacterium]
MNQIDTKNTKRILTELRGVLARGVFGDVVELGCYEGDTSIELAHILKGSGRKLFLYDSFEGLPEKTKEDNSSLGESFKPGELLASKGKIIKRFKHSNLPLPIIKKAWFNNLSSTDLPDQIAFALLDGDFYSSIKDSFSLLHGKLSPGAVIIVDDYSNLALPGAKRATDEWLASNPSAPLSQIGALAIIKL